MENKLCMKRTYLKLLVLTLLLFTGGLKAQDFDDTSDGYGQGDLRYGAKLGATLNQMNFSGLFIGFSGGGFISYGLADFVDVQGELLYTQQGASRSDVIVVYDGIESTLDNVRWFNRSINMQTVQVPITFAFKFPDANAGTVVPKIFIGASYAYMFGAFETRDEEQTYLDGTRAIILGRTENVGSRFKASQVNAIGGMGLDFKYAEDKVFTFDVRYQFSVIDINNNTFELYQGGSLGANTLSIMFGTTF
jgi:hypothetical protein